MRPGLRFELTERGRHVVAMRILYALAAGLWLVVLPFGVAPYVLGLAGVDWHPRPSVLELVLFLAFGLVASFAIGRVWARRRPRPVVELGADGVRLPRIAALRVATFAPYARIRSVVRLGRPVGRERLCVGVEGRMPIAVARQELELPDELEAIERALRERVAAAGDEPDRGASLARQESLARVLRGRGFVVTYGLVAAIALVWLLQRQVEVHPEPVEDLFASVRFGANASWLVARGELWRLVTSPLMHANPLHFIVNAVALAWLGRLYEPLVGPWRLVVLLAVSALAAAGAHVVFERLPGVGFSGALYGIAGCAAALNLRFRDELPAPYRLPSWLWLALPAIEVVQVRLIPALDWPVHLTGFGVGFAVTLAAFGRRELSDLARPAGAATRAAAWGCVGIVAAGIAWAAATSPERDAAWANEAMLPLLLEAAATPGLKNNLAWHYAASPHATHDQLVHAYAVGREILAATPEEPAYRDTLATLAFRLADFETAVELERRVLHARPERFTASQLARFLAAGRAARARGGDGLPGVTLDLEPEAGDGGARVAILRGAHGQVSPVQVEALVRHPDGSPAGLAYAWIDCPEEPAPDLCRVRARGIPAFARLTPTDLGPAPADAVAPAWRYWSMDPAAAALPGPLSPASAAPASSPNPPLGDPVGRTP